MQRSVCKGNAALVQVVAQANLSAERIAPVCHIKLFEIIAVGLNQHRHMQSSQVYGLGNA